MSWFSLVGGLVKLFGTIAAWLQQKQLIDAGKASQRAEDAEELVSRAEKVKAIRRDVDTSFLHPPQERGK